MALSWPSERDQEALCLEDLARTAPGRAKGLEENGAGPSGGGGGERGIFKHRGQGQARWAFRAWGSGGDGIYLPSALARGFE